METNKIDYQGWMAHDRGVDEVAVSGWRKRSERVLKVEIKEMVKIILLQVWKYRYNNIISKKIK